jgi:hypothetical protein
MLLNACLCVYARSQAYTHRQAAAPLMQRMNSRVRGDCAKKRPVVLIFLHLSLANGTETSVFLMS